MINVSSVLLTLVNYYQVINLTLSVSGCTSSVSPPSELKPLT